MSNPLLDDDWVRRESARLENPTYKPNVWLADIEEQKRLVAEYERQVAASLPPPVEFYHTPAYGVWTEPVEHYDPKPFPADGPVKKKKKKKKKKKPPSKSPPPPPPIPPAGSRQIRPIDID